MISGWFDRRKAARNPRQCYYATFVRNLCGGPLASVGMGGPPRLFGRDGDVAAVIAALESSGRCALVGTGGVGKTSVARAVADRVAAGRPVIWVDAEPVADSATLLGRFLSLSGIERLPGESVAHAALAALERGPLLAVLDGVEHLGDDLAEAVGGWPTSVAGPWLLVTSRRPLGRAVLPVVRLQPLVLTGDDKDVATSAAAHMLLAEISALGGDEKPFAADPVTLTEVLAATGGLPIAIQLTAQHVARFGVTVARTTPVPVEEITHRCVNRTLDLLDPGSRRVYEWLGLTAGVFTLDLVAACEGSGSILAAQLVAARLVDHGLVLAVDGGFDLLPPLRDAARELLERGDVLATLTTLIERLVAERPDGSVVSANLDTCVHLVWNAVHRRPAPKVAMTLMDALFRPMYRRLRQLELLTLLEAALQGDLDDHTYAEAALSAATCASECETIAAARQWLARATRRAERLQDDTLWAGLWLTQAWICLDAGEHAGAQVAARRSMVAVPGAGPVMLAALRCVAETMLAIGDLDQAERTAREVLQLTGATPFDRLLARSTLGWCLVERGRWAEAVAFGQQIADEVRRLQPEVSELEVEGDLIAMAADPQREPQAPSLDVAGRYPWWMRLQQRIRLAARLPISQHGERVLSEAADVAVLADLVPLANPRISATILLGDAALAVGDLHESQRAYLAALREAARAPYRLRGADALDGLAVLAERSRLIDLAGSLCSAAAKIRSEAGAVPWRRPSLPERIQRTAPVPPGWVRDGGPTSRAVEEISRELRQPLPTDSLAGLTRAERQVATLVREGFSNQQVADRLVISRRTVESHLARIYRKLGLSSRTQLAAMPDAVRVGHTRGEPSAQERG